MDQKEILKSVVNDLINDKSDNASVSLHNYLTSKMRDVSGLGQTTTEEPIETEDTITGEDNTDDAIDTDTE